MTMGKGFNWDVLLVIDKMCMKGSQNMSRIPQGVKGLVILRPMEYFYEAGFINMADCGVLAEMLDFYSFNQLAI